jgi:hypothetical protein
VLPACSSLTLHSNESYKKEHTSLGIKAVSGYEFGFKKIIVNLGREDIEAKEA